MISIFGDDFVTNDEFYCTLFYYYINNACDEFCW